MPKVYSYNFTSEGEGPWWGIRCQKNFYMDMVRGLEDATRCFVYVTNFEGESITIAVEGPHHEDLEDTIFVPSWLLEKLNLTDGDEVMMDSLSETLPKGTSVTVRPVTGSSVEGPIFLEGLTEALNQLGVIQEGKLFAVVDPSMPDVLHEFMIEELTPEPVCLADGELTVNLERALDRPPSPEPSAVPSAVPEKRPDTPQSHSPFDSSFAPVAPAKPTGFVPFTGKSYRLDGKHS
jgi:hypothetical protein